jgi:hypothetical protein
MAVTSRAKANTAKTSAQPTSASLTPTSRRATSSTAYSDRWLTSDHTVIEIHRWATRSMVRLRNFTVATSQPDTGPRPMIRRSRVATRPASNPNRRAWSSLRSISANTTIAVTSPAMPTTAASTRPPPAPPCSSTRARASTGMPSLMKLFHTPETSTAVVVRDREYPQDPSIE